MAIYLARETLDNPILIHSTEGSVLKVLQNSLRGAVMAAW